MCSFFSLTGNYNNGTMDHEYDSLNLVIGESGKLIIPDLQMGI